MNNPITHPQPDTPSTPATPGTPSTPTPAAGGLFWPVDLNRVRIGPRFLGHWAHGTYRRGYGYHTGVDFLGPMGLAVVSIADGVVVSSTPPASRYGYGNNIVIHHPALGVFTRYSHLDSRAVQTGQTVKAGQLIARLGTSGTDNAHLHFDVIQEALPNPRFCPHNPATGGVSRPLEGLDPIEEALTTRYFRNPIALLNAKTALNPVTRKGATVA
ncbi:M23 family metallopeptidase [Deinococcus sp. YIM 77859]|uniref:M23 family metallopeptidase n=1 Tax=Deinococcus sp. YIM 77859 TaxID=1540221 RepID=UPI000ACC931A|nr:M23 family metallopeptidase [Deinococcus sp. YIM 77859]